MNSGLSRLGIALLAAMFAPALLAADLEKLDVRHCLATGSS